MDVNLSKQAFYEAWKHFELGTKPIALNVLPEGVLRSERELAEERAWEELRQHGFGDRDHEDVLRCAFSPLHRYETAFDVTYRYRENDEEYRLSGLAAYADPDSVFAVQSEETVRISTLTEYSLVRAALSVLPAFKPGPGTGVSLRSEQLESAAAGAGNSHRAMHEGLIGQGVRRDEAHALIDMIGSERVAYAQFGASIMDSYGKRTRAPMVTNCFATARGWYLMEEKHYSGDPWTTVAPIDHTRMATRIQNVLDTIETH